MVERTGTGTARDGFAIATGHVMSGRAAPVIERAPLPLVEVQGPTHVVTRVNPAFCALLAMSRAQLVGRPFSELVPAGDACLSLLDRVYELGLDDQTEWLYALWPALNPDDRAEGVIVGLATESKISTRRRRVTDVNEALLISSLREHESREATEQANVRLALTDRNKDDFLAMLAHELRNPLAPIKNAAEAIRMAHSADIAIVRAQEIIERQVAHLAKLVDELLDLSRIQRGKITLERVHVDLADAVVRAIESCDTLIASHRHEVTLDLPPVATLYVDGDATRIDQILVNLICNAAKYTRPAGKIHIGVVREDETAVIRIRDTGIGIAHGDLRRVFDVFAQVEHSLERSEGGLGLGLKLVKELVELHGGQVEATSDGLGKGSEFVVRLPALAATTRVAPVPAPVASGQPRRILVVDDIADNRETMEMLLTMNGHDVELAEDGEQAVEKALAGHPDVAFVDIGLPKLSGYEVAREIRRQPGGEHIVLIALSGYGQPEDKRKAAEAGFDAHFTKPVASAILKQVLEDLAKFAR